MSAVMVCGYFLEDDPYVRVASESSIIVLKCHQEVSKVLKWDF